MSGFRVQGLCWVLCVAVLAGFRDEGRAFCAGLGFAVLCKTSAQMCSNQVFLSPAWAAAPPPLRLYYTPKPEPERTAGDASGAGSGCWATAQSPVPCAGRSRRPRKGLSQDTRPWPTSSSEAPKHAAPWSWTTVQNASSDKVPGNAAAEPDTQGARC